jgi:hypothetical protein
LASLFLCCAILYSYCSSLTKLLPQIPPGDLAILDGEDVVGVAAPAGRVELAGEGDGVAIDGQVNVLDFTLDVKDVAIPPVCQLVGSEATAAVADTSVGAKEVTVASLSPALTASTNWLTRAIGSMATRSAAGGDHLQPHQRIFVGVIDVLNPTVESPATVRERVLQAATYIPPQQLGTTDDCGFSPFGNDVSTARETAFAKICARVLGTAEAAAKLGM